jgi:hypothetical protein
VEEVSGFTLVPEFQVPFSWDSAINSNDSEWPFRKTKFRVSADLAERLRGPGIYRFVFFDEKDAIREIYIGESECFLRRHRSYRASNEPIKVDWIKFDWDKHRKEQVKRKLAGAQHRVELQILKVKCFQLNKVGIDQGSLTDPFVRKLLENLTILDANAQGIRILNRGRSKGHKQFAKMVKEIHRSGRVNATQE